MDAAKLHDALRTHSRFIRDYLAPNMARDGDGYTMTSTDHKTLNSIFVKLSELSVTKTALYYSRIHNALFMITSGGAPWPAEFVLLAETLLKQWEKKLGRLKDIRPDLWGPGGRLHGLRRLRDSGAGLSLNEGAITFTPVTAPDLASVHRVGDLGFKPGDWWLNTGAACRDGIIDSPCEPITADDRLAYAIIVTSIELPGDKKIVSVEENGKFIYRFAASDDERTDNWPTWTSVLFSVRRAGIYQLLRCIQFGGSPIRVLRTHNFTSFMSPKAGVRYDGLYRIRGYVWIGPKEFRGEQVRMSHYRFLLQRIEENQLPWTEAFRHPIAEELDDWTEYMRTQVNEDGQEIAKALNVHLDEVRTEVGAPSPGSETAVGSNDYFDVNQAELPSTSSLKPEPASEDNGDSETTPRQIKCQLNGHEREGTMSFACARVSQAFDKN